METIKLNNGIECPVIGIGTFMLKPADTQNSVREALKMGYSLVDTANAYVNERAVGRGIKESGLKREEVFISTKLWPSEYENENAVVPILDPRDVIIRKFKRAVTDSGSEVRRGDGKEGRQYGNGNCRAGKTGVRA